MRKLARYFSCIFFFGLLSLTTACRANPQADQQRKIDKLQGEITELQLQVNRLQEKPALVTKRAKHRRVTYRRAKARRAVAMTKGRTSFRRGLDSLNPHFLNNYVVLAPYTERPTYNTATSLVINAPSINMDSKLLMRRMLEDLALQNQGKKTPVQPRLVLSGALEAQAIYMRPYIGARSTDIDFTRATLDAFAELTSFVNGLMSFDYNKAVGATPRRVSNSNVRLDKGFLLLGDLQRTPFYGSVGQQYVPFGRYSTNMIVDPLTKDLGAIKTRAVILGYAPTKDITPTARLFIFQGDTYYSGSDFAKRYGVDLALRILKPKYHVYVGTSYVNNMADSNGMQVTGAAAGFRGFDTSNVEKLQHRIGGGVVYGIAGYGPFTIMAEALSALQEFSTQDVTYNGRGAKPKAANFEAAYSFHLFNRPMSFAVGYGRSAQALAFNIPRQRYDAALSMTITQDLIGTLEFQHNINYGASENATAQGLTAVTANELGRTNDVITAQLGVYF